MAAAVEAKPFSNDAGRHLDVDIFYPAHDARKA